MNRQNIQVRLKNRPATEGCTPGFSGSGRNGFTLVETLIALALGITVLAGTIQFLNVSNRSVVKTSDHVQGRIEASRILDAIQADLERAVVDDDLINLVIPLHFEDGGQRFWFYAFHHREVDESIQSMTLVARKLIWDTVPAPGGGFHVRRNGKRFSPAGLTPVGPVSELRFESLTRDQACELQVSPYHAAFVKVYMRGAWDKKNSALASEANVQTRLMHVSHIESQYACMLTIKNSGPPSGVFTNLDKLDDPFTTFNCPIQSIPSSIPLDWVRPLGLVQYDDSRTFDDERLDEDVRLP